MSRNKAPELLRELMAKTAAVLREKGGLAENVSNELAAAVVDMVRADLGGQLIYFPKGTMMDVQARDLDMWQDFNGHNHEELARKYDLAVPVVYDRLKKIKRHIMARHQTELFDD